ncbi:MAG: hypothetical protein LC789_13400 [Actinobacteria bacterium]|nr:hypothetical protein [Actinomycetota bacterium]MCA1721162.1 hypothetical protein [Actinomycetota bacterium]
MPDLTELLTDSAARHAVAPRGGFADVEQRASRNRKRKAALVAVLGSGAAAVVVLVASTVAPRAGVQPDQPSIPGSESSAQQPPPCPPPPRGVQGAGEPGPYGSGLGSAVAAELDGWRVSAPDPRTGDFPGCASSGEERAKARAVHYPLADYDAVVGGRVQVETQAGPSGPTIQLTTARYTPSLTEDDAAAVARGFLDQQAEELRQMIAQNPSPAPGGPTAVSVATAPESEGKTASGGHWWIYRGQQNKFGFAWTPNGALTVARMDPDLQTDEATRWLRDALLAAAEFQASR